MNSREKFQISKLSIRRLNSPHDDCNAVNLETIVFGDKTLEKHGFHGGPQSFGIPVPDPAIRDYLLR